MEFDPVSQDKSTIVSMLPWLIKENKPAIYPGEFIIQPAEKDDISILVVGQSAFYVTMDNRTIKQTTPSIQMAQSVAYDYIQASLDTYEDAGPGIFALFGGLTKEQVKKNHQLELIEYARRQRNWFDRLVRHADDEWNRNHQYKTISDIHRAAAKSLGLDKEWSRSHAEASMSKCPACLSLIDPDAMICLNCKTVVKPAEYAKLNAANEALMKPVVK